MGAHSHKHTGAISQSHSHNVFRTLIPPHTHNTCYHIHTHAHSHTPLYLLRKTLNEHAICSWKSEFAKEGSCVCSVCWWLCTVNVLHTVAFGLAGWLAGCCFIFLRLTLLWREATTRKGRRAAGLHLLKIGKGGKTFPNDSLVLSRAAIYCGA